ncbi:hypothetical protein CLU96_1685 [Chryseobacterium sp. 52]|uniref:hypothetical protein n=1 Tax=Chryseobacterium sp. 52 TaxID=2035213 RepID=UPI000C1A78EE|nr:hypothetical protein [Chryseobacterium sp. 52]PIF44693.1 hypothetical protein CLU96_1685 [Chryseobacterium sp. 52]
MNKIIRTLLLIFAGATIIMVISLFTMLPWWSFVVPCIILGIVLPFQKFGLSPFMIGFLAGFLAWSLAHVYYDVSLDSKIMDKLALIIDYPKWCIFAFSGLIGGVLSGLALLTGQKMFVNDFSKL